MLRSAHHCAIANEQTPTPGPGRSRPHLAGSELLFQSIRFSAANNATSAGPRPDLRKAPLPPSVCVPLENGCGAPARTLPPEIVRSLAHQDGCPVRETETAPSSQKQTLSLCLHSRARNTKASHRTDRAPKTVVPSSDQQWQRQTCHPDRRASNGPSLRRDGLKLRCRFACESSAL